MDLEINGEIWYVWDYSKVIWDEVGDNILGIFCIMILIFKGDCYNWLFKDVLIGLYKVWINVKGDYEFVYCNDYFV